MNIIKIVAVFLCCFSMVVQANLVSTINKIKPSVVGVGIYTPLGRPKSKLFGSGFVIGNGEYIVTNHHVIAHELDHELKQEVAVFIGSGKQSTFKRADIVAIDELHDLAILKIQGKQLPPMVLASNVYIDDGTAIAFTGFPIGSVLGLYPMTHRGIIAGLTPSINPVEQSRQLDIRRLKQLRQQFMVYQLDATAYPGNSGSAMYNANTGEVLGIINKVFVQGSKESVLSKPSGITYAIPVKYLHTLLKKNNIQLN